jgi:hypothetical protein
VDARIRDEVDLAVDALGVDLEQYGDALPGPLGDLGGRDAAVEPAGDAGMAQVVYARRASCDAYSDGVSAVPRALSMSGGR